MIRLFFLEVKDSMFILKKRFNSLYVDLMVTKAKVRGIELTLEYFSKLLRETLDQNQSVIDTNKIVLDKLEEILKSKGLD